MSITDDRTPRFNLPLPAKTNKLIDDCERLRQTIYELDEKVATIDDLGSDDGYKLVKSDQERTLESFRESLVMTDAGVWLAADNWIKETRGIVTVGGREYTFSAPLTLTGLYRCAGLGKTKLTFTHGGDGVIFDTPAGEMGWQYGFTGGITIQTSGVNAGTAIATTKGKYFTQRPRMILESVEVQDSNGPDMSKPGFPCIYSWSCGFDIGDVQGLDVGELYFYGNYDPLVADAGQLQSVALRMTGTQTMLFPRLGALWFNAPRVGVEIGDRCFFFIDTVDITRAWIGIRTISDAPYSEVFANRVAINAQKTGMDLANLTRLTIAESFINSRADGFEHTEQWVGYKFTNIQKSTIGAITAQPNHKYGGTTCAIISGCSGITMTSIVVGAMIDVGLLADNSAGYAATINWQSVEAAGVPYKATNASRSALVKIIAPTSWLGSMYSFDATIDRRWQSVEAIGSNTQFSQRSGGSFLSPLDIMDYRNTETANRGMRITVGNDGTASLQIFDKVSGTGTTAIQINRTDATVNSTEMRGTENIVPVCRPNADNVRTLGTASYRFSTVYAGTGTISTSDEREKTFCDDELSDKVLDVWATIDWRTFRFNDAIEKKGAELARVHFGLGAQTVIQAFADAGIDATRFALICYDEWEEELELKNDEGEVTRPYKAAGNRYGIRYEEALALEAALMRRTTKRLEERLAALEGK